MIKKAYKMKVKKKIISNKFMKMKILKQNKLLFKVEIKLIK